MRLHEGREGLTSSSRCWLGERWETREGEKLGKDVPDKTRVRGGGPAWDEARICCFESVVEIPSRIVMLCYL